MQSIRILVELLLLFVSVQQFARNFLYFQLQTIEYII